MATCLDVITSAMKLAKALPSGGTPTSAETADGMECLQSLYDGWVSGGMFGTLTDRYLSGDEDAQEGFRYYVPTGITLTAATNDYVPQFGDSYSECDYASGIGDTRQPRDLALYESLTQAGTRSVKLYDRTQWVELTGLASDDEAPLSNRGAMGLAACLATSGAFSDMFGAEIGQGTLILAAQFIKQLMRKSGATQDDSGGTFY